MTLRHSYAHKTLFSSLLLLLLTKKKLSENEESFFELNKIIIKKI